MLVSKKDLAYRSDDFSRNDTTGALCEATTTKL